MSGKLDQSLDEILSTRRTGTAARGRPRRRGATTRAAPVGGVSKSAAKATTKTTGKGNATAAAGGIDSKIIVSNLPPDVSEDQIKEYFGKSVGSVKRATITYGPNGISRGVATVIFNKPGIANKAAATLNGLLVDKRPMKVEVVLDASRVPPPETAKGISDRISKPKVQPKQVKVTTAATRGSTRGRAGRAGRARGTGRPSRKTAEELDAEMTDYFVGGTGPANNGAGATNGAPAAAAGGDDLGMDEIS